MIKITVFLAFYFSFSINLFGQNSHIDQLIKKYDNNEFREKLVDKALINFPDFLIEEQNEIIANHELSLVKHDILNKITVSGNLNESAINPPDANVTTNVYYPRYNIGVVIPLGLFSIRKHAIKIAEKKQLISHLNVEQATLQVKREVLTVLNDYLLALRVFGLRNEITEDANTNHTTMQEKYENGEISSVEYNNEAKIYKLETEKQMIAKTEADNKKLELEMWIGISLEDLD